MCRELLPAASSRAYHAEPSWLQVLLPFSNSMTTKHFRNHPGGFIRSAGAHVLGVGFPPEKVMLQALYPQASWPGWTEKHPCSTSNSSVESPQLLVGFQDIGIGLLSPLLSGSQTQPDKQLRVQPIRSPKLFWLRGDSNSPVKHDCPSYKEGKL